MAIHRKRVAAVIVAAVTTILGSFTIGRAAGPGQPQPITIHEQKPVGTNTTGTFEATGAISDSGTATNDDFDRQLNAYPRNEVLHITVRFHGGGGDLTVNMEIRVTQSGQPSVENEDGSWQLVVGTGAYAALQGEGNETAVVDHNTQEVSRTLTGEVH